MSPAQILLVDDDEDLRAVLRVVLESAGYTVLESSCGEEGLDVCARERPDLILLDVMMPEGTEGFHVVWRMRQLDDPYFRDVPVIMLTAIHQRTPLRFYPDAGDGTYQAGEYLPVQGFVDKPVDPPALLQEIRRVLGTWTGQAPDPPPRA